MTLDIRLYHDINEIDKESWNRLAQNESIFFDYEWFQLFQNNVGQKTVYYSVLLNNQLILVLPGFIVTDPKTYPYHNLRSLLFDRYDLDQIVQGILCKNEKSKGYSFLLNRLVDLICLNHWWINKLFFPNLTFLSPIGYVSRMLIDDALESPSQILQALFGFIDVYCRKHRIKVQGFLWSPATDKFLQYELKQLDFLKVFADMEFNLALSWKSFEDYLQAMRSNKRQKIKYQIKCGEKNNILISECHDFSKIASEIGELGENLQNKYDLYEYDAKALKSRYVEVHKTFKDKSRVFVARKNEKLVAFLIVLIKNKIYYPKFLGFDYRFCENSYTYFNLIFYKTIEAAIQDQATEIVYSMTSGQAKLKRGCEKSEVFCYYRFKNRVIHKIFRYYLRFYDKMKIRFFEYSLPPSTVWKQL